MLVFIICSQGKKLTYCIIPINRKNWHFQSNLGGQVTLYACYASWAERHVNKWTQICNCHTQLCSFKLLWEQLHQLGIYCTRIDPHIHYKSAGTTGVQFALNIVSVFNGHRYMGANGAQFCAQCNSEFRTLHHWYILRSSMRWYIQQCDRFSAFRDTANAL